MILPNPAPKDK